MSRADKKEYYAAAREEQGERDQKRGYRIKHASRFFRVSAEEYEGIREKEEGEDQSRRRIVLYREGAAEKVSEGHRKPRKDPFFF